MDAAMDRQISAPCYSASRMNDAAATTLESSLSLETSPTARRVVCWAGILVIWAFVAGFFAYPVNRWLLQRGKGHMAVHETGIHGGPDPRAVGVIAAAAGLFGAIVLIADVL